jgi:hypothetical protein
MAIVQLKTFVVVLFLVVGSSYLAAATYTTANCSSSAFQSAINSASDGDTVQGPVSGGSATWSINIVVHNPDRSLIIDGRGCVITLTSGASGIQMFTTPNYYPRITNFAFQASGSTGVGIMINGSNAHFRVDHNKFTNLSDRAVYVNYGGLVGSATQAYGVIDHNTVTNTNPMIAFQVYGNNNTWLSDVNYGTANAVYVEDNTFTWNGLSSSSDSATDCERGGRIVVRHNDITNGTAGLHDLGSSPRSRSCRMWERYSNTFHRNINGDSASALSYRGGTGMDFDNSVPIDAANVNGWSVAIGAQIHRLDCSGGRCGPPQDFPVAAATHAVCSSFQGWCSNKGACENDGDCSGGTCSSTTSPPDSTYCGSNGAGTNYISIANIDGSGSPSGYPARDQTAASKDDPTTHGQTGAADPAYSWNNTDSRNGGALITSTMVDTSLTSMYILPNREYYQQGSSFDGTTGVGRGLLSARPATCTPKVGYWATDANTLYQCSSRNTWNPYYTPYTYPHPLQGGGGPAPPAGLTAVIQ